MAKTKAFKITQNNQYIQEINLNAGEYTFSANIRADSASITVCKFSLLVGDVWLEYDLTDQIYIGQFQKVKKVIQLNDKATKLSLISSGSGEGRIFHVDRPMFEEGSNAGTPKPNELDIEEQAEASNVKVTIGIPYYEFRKDAEGGTVQETLTIPFQIFKGNVRVNVPSANIGTLSKPSNVMVLDVVGVYNSVNVTILKEFTASDGKVVFSIPVEGRNYEAEFQFKVKEVKDGDDGENAKWIKLNATATQIKVDEDNVSLPESISVFAQMYNLSGIATWLYSINGGSFTEVAPTGVSRNQNVVTITSANVNFEVLTIQASKDGVEDAITISRVVDGKDGQRGLPGKVPVTKEYKVGQTYYNNETAVHYVYYRAGNSWWKLKDGVESYTVVASPPDTTYFEQLSSVEVMVAETIIAENANLAGFIFKDNKLISQRGTVGGVAADYSGQAGFEPNILIDGRNGYIYVRRGEFEGVVKADSGSIGKWEIIGESITSPNKRLILDSLSNAMSMLDEYGATRVLIKPEPISSLNDYFTEGSGGSINISSLIGSYNSSNSGASSPIVSISTSGGKVYEAIIPTFTINVNVDVVPMGGGTTQPMGVVADLVVYFRTSHTTKVEIGRASVMSIEGFEENTVQVSSSTRVITKDGDYSLQVVLEISNPGEQIVTASGSFSSSITTIPINQIVNRSEIGTNGMVIATSPTSYTYMGESEFAARKGSYGIRVTSSGIQKMTNGSTWVTANI